MNNTPTYQIHTSLRPSKPPKISKSPKPHFSPIKSKSQFSLTTIIGLLEPRLLDERRHIIVVSRLWLPSTLLLSLVARHGIVDRRQMHVVVSLQPVGIAGVQNLLSQPDQTKEGEECAGYHEAAVEHVRRYVLRRQHVHRQGHYLRTFSG